MPPALLFLPEVQQFFMNKHFSVCCLTLVDYQSPEIVVFYNFAQYNSCFGEENLLTSSLCRGQRKFLCPWTNGALYELSELCSLTEGTLFSAELALH